VGHGLREPTSTPAGEAEREETALNTKPLDPLKPVNQRISPRRAAASSRSTFALTRSRRKPARTAARNFHRRRHQQDARQCQPTPRCSRRWNQRRPPKPNRSQTTKKTPHEKISVIIGCALAAFADRLCGRGLAVNEAPVAAIPGTLPSETPVVTVGIPTNLDPEKILARKKALIAAGTEPLLAEKLAIDAEQQQYLRDHQLSVSATVEERPPLRRSSSSRLASDGEPEK
jgi:hypothetical protein